MSIELLPVGMRCDLACTGCYEHSMRRAGNEGGEYDLDAMKAAAMAAGVGKPDGRGGITGWTGFGGEFLLTPVDAINALFEWSASLNAPIGIQTNGALITEHHIALFKQYRVHVGISVDGPDELNDWRVANVALEHQAKVTRVKTAKSIANLERCLREGISTSLIVTVSKFNAGTDERLERLIRWLLGLRDLGLRYVNLHLLETHNIDEETHAFTQARQIEVFRQLRRELVGFAHVSPFADIKAKLLEGGTAHCTFNFCSPYSTPAVTGINGSGEAARCGRLNVDGVARERSQAHGHERYLSLYTVPMAYGGCGGCRFFLSCGGGNCPGEAEIGDWRRKTVHCQTLTPLFEDAEKELFSEGKEPISTSLRRPLLEYRLLSKWAGLSDANDSTVSGNREHGDIPHGDSYEHQDHTDTERPVIINEKGERIQ